MKTLFTPPYEGWAPYCLVCKTMQRMELMPYGWKCTKCQNEIDHNLAHHSGVTPKAEQIHLLQATLEQYRTLNIQMAAGWQWDGYGSDGSLNIKHEKTWEQKYIRTDGTIRDR